MIPILILCVPWTLLGMRIVIAIAAAAGHHDISIWFLDWPDRYDSGENWITLLLFVYLFFLGFLWPLVLFYWFCILLGNKIADRWYPNE